MKTVFIAVFAGMVGCASVQPISEADAAPTWSEKVLYSFCSQPNCSDGASPSSGLTDVKGLLFGTTRLGGQYKSEDGTSGTVFSLDPGTGMENVLYSFCAQPKCTDGEQPSGNLIVVNGLLYGTTRFGGAHGAGTVFRLDPKIGALKVLYSFCARTNCTDGEIPGGGLIFANGALYGTTLAGGNENEYCGGYVSCGTVFSVNLNSGAERVLYAFCSQGNCMDGAFPGGLIDVNGTLYGTTTGGGANNGGTAFAVDSLSGEETVLYSFCAQQNCVDGEIPAGLVDVNGILYGATEYGGTGKGNGCNDPGCGTVFSLDPGSGTETVLYSFTGGYTIPLNLISVKDKLYGTTSFGGNVTDCSGFGCGTVFSVDLGTGAEKVLYSFCNQTNCADGSGPLDLIHVKGALFGTTAEGGTNGYGAAFVLQRDH